MSNSIRLSVFGKKNQRIYRIVVSETRYKRNGKFLDILGVYNPNQNPPFLKIDEKKLQEWQQKGALLSSGLRKLLKTNQQN